MEIHAAFEEDSRNRLAAVVRLRLEPERPFEPDALRLRRSHKTRTTHKSYIPISLEPRSGPATFPAPVSEVGRLVVKSNPPGLKVEIVNEALQTIAGLTPMILENEPVGKYTVTARRGRNRSAEASA